MRSTNNELVNKFISAYNSMDIDAMLVQLHPEIKFKNISSGEVNAETNGIDEFETLARQSAGLFKSRRQEIQLLEEKEDGSVTVEILFHAELATDFPGGLMKGDFLDIPGKSFYTFKDGLIFSITDES